MSYRPKSSAFEEDRRMRRIRIGDNIRDRRKAAGMTLRDVAERLAVSQATISNWENGNHNIAVQFIPDIAAVLDCDIKDLFK